MMPDSELLAAATAARLRAYAPYSGFLVGAALRTTDGLVIAGCNVENASYGHTICAERTALVAAVAQGMIGFTEMVVVTAAEFPSMPCGACLQMMQEFSVEAWIRCANLTGIVRQGRLREIYPYPFGPQDLGQPADPAARRRPS